MRGLLVAVGMAVVCAACGSQPASPVEGAA